ncbi:DUF4435 domain-containing protein [Bacillus sp. JJ689]|uniref:DUF4435 domain-containing protein n=1 Tax=Bacillus sp. JJ689 TaxID=3122949 RepID=UPI002FFE5509
MEDRMIILPDKELENKEYSIGKSQSVVIIGANGAGKSRLGAWIEQNNLENVHRVSAQRSLEIPNYVNLKGFEQAFDDFFWGDANYKGPEQKKGTRWGWGKHTTSLLNDYDKVLTTLFAKQSKINDEFVKKCKEKERQGLLHDKAPETEIDIIIKIWKDIYPHRELKLEDAKVSVSFSEMEYHGSEMSDGERVALYLMGQCLCAPLNSIIIIDEPEIHLHKSIINRLWNKLEEERQDCLFIYITHDIQFATAHKNCKKLWVHEYLGDEMWELEFINETEGLPEELLLEILGSRKRLLFIEGDRDSLDYSLYRHFYDDFHVIPCGSCTKVIESTKSMRGNTQLHHLEVYGLIDRDYRTEEEIKSLQGHNILTLDIAEVENLFCVEEILEMVAEHMIFNEEKVQEVKESIIQSFKRDIDKQINNAVVNEIKYRLSVYDVNKKVFSEIEQAVNDLPDILNVNEIYQKNKLIFSNLLEEGKYRDVLKYYNQKGISKTIGRFFGHQNNDYCNLVLRLLNTEKKEKIIQGLSLYLPAFPSLESPDLPVIPIGAD